MMLKKISILLLLLMLFNVTWSQIDIKLLSTPDTIELGQDLNLTLILKAENALNISSIELSMFDSLGLYKMMMPDDTVAAKLPGGTADFEIADFGVWKNTGTNVLTGNEENAFITNENGEIENKFIIKVWDAGTYMIMINQIIYMKGNSIDTLMPDRFHASIIHVLQPGELNEGEQVQLLPIKDILREGWHWMDFKWLYVALLGILLIIFIIRSPKRKIRKEYKAAQKEIIIRPAHEIAFEKLAILKEKELWQKGNIKAFQSELSHITREYLENRYSIKALENTTSVIIKEVTNIGFKDNDITMLRELLMIADLVKFAKAKPSENIHEMFLEKAINFVEKTKLIVIKDEKKSD